MRRTSEETSGARARSVALRAIALTVALTSGLVLGWLITGPPEHGGAWVGEETWVIGSPEGRPRGSLAPSGLDAQLGRDSGPGPGALVFIVLFAATLIASVVLPIGTPRSNPRSSDDELRPRSGPPEAFAWGAVVIAIVGAAATVTAIRWVGDDFRFLEDSDLRLGRLDALLRWSSANARYRLLGKIGSPLWAFGALNLGAFTVACAGWSLLVYRAGASRASALLAGALLTAGPGMHSLLAWGCGFEHLAAQALIVLVLLLSDRALRDEEGRRRAGTLLLACALTASVAFVKLQMLALVPPLAALWAWRAIPNADAREAARLFVYLSLAAGVTLYTCLPVEAGVQELEIAARDPIFLDGWKAATWDAARWPLWALLLVLGFGLAKRASTCGRNSVPGCRARTRSRPPLSAPRVLEVLRGLWQGPTPALAIAVIVLAVPFVYQAGHFPTYYAAAAYFPITAALAVGIAASIDWAKPPPWLGAAALALLAAGTSVSVYRDRASMNATEPVAEGLHTEHGLTRWLAAVQQSSRGLEPPALLHIRARCEDDPELEASSREDLVVFEDLAGPKGVRWTIGWRETEVRFHGRADESPPSAGPEPAITLEHCREGPPRFR